MTRSTSDDPIDLTDSPPVDVILAHLMLGTVSAAKGAIELVLANDYDESTQDALLKLANRRLEFVANQLHSLSAGLPPDALADFVEQYEDASRRGMAG
jgi:hypothetical protein